MERLGAGRWPAAQFARLARRAAARLARGAHRAGVSTGTIRRLLDPDESRDIGLGTLVALADVLLMDVWELLEPLRGEQ